jgi:uncharacterized membrane protein
MNVVWTHLGNKMLAGALALAPIAIVAVAAVWLEHNTRPLAEVLRLPPFPGLGILVGLVLVYVTGVLVTSLIGGALVGALDYFLQRVPGLNLAYRTWKEVLLVPRGKGGVYQQVVLIPNRDGGSQLGFTSGEDLPGTPPRWCVFVPGLPNPLSGQLVLVPRSSCTPLAVSVEEAFKFLLSSGNYVPPGLAAAERKQEMA